MACLVVSAAISMAQLNIKNKDMEIMKNYETRETVTLDQLMPDWWGYCKIEEII